MSQRGLLADFAERPLLKRFIDYLKQQGNEFAADPAGYLESSARAALPPDPLGGYNAQGVPQMNPEATKWLADNVGFGAMTVYHGSPHVFDKFDMSRLGSGEGAQAYGRGLYFAESPDVAKSYQPRSEKYERHLMKAYDKAMAKFDYDAAEAYEAAMLHKTPQEISELMGSRAPMAQNEIAKLYGKDSSGAFYKVDIPDEAVERMLDWDAPLSGNQSLIEAVRREVPGYMQLPPGQTKAQDAYYALSEKVGEEKAAQVLRDAGIPGIKYFDGQSRAGAEGTRNFVLFDDRLPRILERNGVPTGNQPWKPGEMKGLLGYR